MRAIWLDMLCLMHDSDRRGYLSRNDSPLSPEQIAAFCGCSAAEVTLASRVLIDSGVASCTEHGILYCRRMVRDERKRNLCSEAGRKGGGNPALQTTFKGRSKGGYRGTLDIDNGKDPPSGETGRGGAGGFATFWASYPRKTAKKAAQKAWNRLRPDAALEERILAALAVHKASRQWAEGIIPHPATWLNGRRWEDEAVESAGRSSPPPESPQERTARLERL